MKDYTYIEKVKPQDGGISNVFLRGNKRAIIEITKLEDKFKAEIYHQYTGNPKESAQKKRKNLVKKIESNNSNELLKESLGWIDENHGDIPVMDEIKVNK